jgi:glycosyltransferase involved in cell wall biosynthesis
VTAQPTERAVGFRPVELDVPANAVMPQGAPPPRPPSRGQAARISADGKFFSCGERRFQFQGVTYGTFRQRADGALFPGSDVLADDMAQIAQAGFTVVRTYTPPPADLLEHAAVNGLHVFAGAFFEDWRYLLGNSRRERVRMARRARQSVRDAVRGLAGNPTVAALSISNEVPADVIRWVGADAVSSLLGELVEIVHAEDPQLLVTYGNYPSTEYLWIPGLDFLTFNVFLEREADFRAYLARLHNLAGDRPLVLGEIGLDSGRGEELQASTLDWQLEAALERGIAGTCLFSWTDDWWVGEKRVEGWHFGLTDDARRPRPALEVARRWNQADLTDVKTEWPTMTIVVCAYNAAETLDECLQHVCALDYPRLDVVVVDDGSTDATAQIAERHERVQVISTEQSGLSNARNVGARASTGEIVAFLDSDAFPPPEWPYLLALGFDSPRVGGVGGPNIPPRDDPLVAQAVARAPGGPVHVLLSDDRAEHVPGCNMAFWRELILELDGFDPVFTAAGDDVDFCWRVLDADWRLAFHPAAFVWHRRRSSVGGYLRQQRGYGRAEALVQSRHPERFTPIGTAKWRGSIYGSLAQRLLRPRIYRGQYGAAAYQSVYRGQGHGWDIAHQVGMPLAALVLLTAPVGIVAWEWSIPAMLALGWALSLFALDAMAIRPARGVGRRTHVRLLAAALHLAQPVPRLWGLLRESRRSRRERNGRYHDLRVAGPVQHLPGGVLLLPLAEPRASYVPKLTACLHASGIRTAITGPWEDHDAVVSGSSLVDGKLVTSAHPEGTVQLRIDPRPRLVRLIVPVCVIGILAAIVPLAAAAVAALTAVEAGRGLWRVGPASRRAVQRAAQPDG